MPSHPEARVSGYCFTINNYSADDVTKLHLLDYQYLIIGFEKGKKGTRHIQGYIHYKISQRFSKVKKDLPTAHIEQRKGTAQQASDYCKKENNFIELGTIPLAKGDASKLVWKEILEHAKQGDYVWLQDNYPRVWINLSNRLESLRTPKTTILDGELDHEWWIGQTGTGKSKLLWELYPEHYQKDTNKWWCGYRDQTVVAIEEWSPKNECTGAQLKIWADRYPFSGQIKGGTLQRIRPLKIIVLSNYEIEDCFTDSRDRDPITRRFTILRFPDDIHVARERMNGFSNDLNNTSSIITTNVGNDNVVQRPSTPPLADAMVVDSDFNFTDRMDLHCTNEPYDWHTFIELDVDETSLDNLLGAELSMI